MLPYKSEQVDPIEKIFRKPQADRCSSAGSELDFSIGGLGSIAG